MIQCTNITKEYKMGSRCFGLKKQTVKTAVHDLSFHVKRGTTFALLGNNGAGKTTTIKMILGLTKATEGIITIADGASIGYSPETPYFPAFLTGREVLEYYGKIQKIPGEKLQEQIPELLNLVKLEDDVVRVKMYSKGMLQRLALAQALLGDPEILILDEPTAGLDAFGRAEMIALIGRLKKQGKTILLNSHILDDVEKVCDEGIILRSGELIGSWKGTTIESESLEEKFIRLMGGLEK